MSGLNEDARFRVVIDDVTGEKYWTGAADGDKDKTENEVLELKAEHFNEGYTVVGYEPEPTL